MMKGLCNLPILREIQFNILQQTAQRPLTSILPAPLDNTLTIQIIIHTE